MASCEPAALELACIVNKIKDIIVCGHSDCKAMNLLYELRHKSESTIIQKRKSPLRSWLCHHGAASLEKLLKMNGDFKKSMSFTGETEQTKFVAYIDPENKFCIRDKLSQVNTLQQIQNISSYDMLRSLLENRELHIHALWFDMHNGEVYYFSRKDKVFIIIDELSYHKIISEIKYYYE